MNSIALILGLPLVGFLINGIFGKNLPKSIVGWLGTFTVLASFVIALGVFNDLRHAAIPSEGLHLKLFTFLNIENFNVDFSFTLDRLSIMMTLIITGIGSLIHLYSIAYMHEDEGFYKFFAYLNFFIFNMLMLVLGANFLMLFFGWEGVGLCSYLLIGFWYKNAEYGKAARKAFIMNRIGDLGLLMGLFLIFHQYQSLDYSIVLPKMADGSTSQAMLTAISMCLFVGAMGKSAQIPLYTWLPDAMAGPTPVSALIHAATMVTAGVYLVVRCEALFYLSPITNNVIMWVGLATSIMAALIGLKQNDIKKVLAYSTVSQLGLMFVALGCGAYSAAMFHLATHAFFKALLFLGSGSVIHAMHHEQDIRQMGGLKSKMPITYITFLIGTLAITGFPFLSGFFSKDEILLAAFEHNKIVYILSVISATITGLYMFRMFFVTFHGTYRNHHHSFDKVHESPWQMSLPLMILAVLSVLGGLLNLPSYLGHNVSMKLSHWLAPILPMAESHSELSHNTEFMLVGLVVLLFVLVVLYTRNKYVSKNAVPEEDALTPSTGKVLVNKFYIDELYDMVFVKPLELLSSLVDNVVDSKLIGGLIIGVSTLLVAISGLNKKIQNGNIEYYLTFMVLALALFLGFNLFF